MTLPERAPGSRFTVGVVCSVGIGPQRGGRSRNEDNYLLCRDGRVSWREADDEVSFPVGPAPGLLFAVADGMGGHEDGELASAAAVQAMARLYARPLPADPEDALRTFVLEAHRRLRARVSNGGPVKMGTTLSVAWVLGNRAYWAHVGDSRLYHWRAGRLVRITRDHTRAEFARRDGRPEPKHPDYLSQSFIYGSRGLGDDDGLRLDRGLDSGSLTLLAGDRLLACSDGLSGRVEDALLADALTHVPDPAACAAALYDRAVAYHSDDNITAVIVRVNHLDDDDDDEEETTLVPV